MAITTTQAEQLLTWYETNHRELPWRDTGDPFDVWISEIMLQQTRVEFVKERFVRFKEVIPDIPSLSCIPEDTLMKLWEGMGYYSRARNLKKCAEILMEQHGGALPSDPAQLRRLPGIGPYTAGAIASIAYEIPEPAVDGNVLRVLARLFHEERDIRADIVRKEFEQELRQFFTLAGDGLIQRTPKFVSRFTQALMELGALVCLPNGEPHCELCPWSSTCIAYQNHTTDRIPYRSKLKARRILPRTITVIRDGERFLLHKRKEGGLLGGLYEFPGYESHLSRNVVIKQLEADGIPVLKLTSLPASRHIFSHVEWDMIAYEIRTASMEEVPGEDYVLLTKKELQHFAVPSAFHAYKAYYSLND